MLGLPHFQQLGVTLGPAVFTGDVADVDIGGAACATKLEVQGHATNFANCFLCGLRSHHK